MMSLTGTSYFKSSIEPDETRIIAAPLLAIEGLLHSLARSYSRMLLLIISISIRGERYGILYRRQYSDQFIPAPSCEVRCDRLLIGKVTKFGAASPRTDVRYGARKNRGRWPNLSAALRMKWACADTGSPQPCFARSNSPLARFLRHMLHRPFTCARHATMALVVWNSGKRTIAPPSYYRVRACNGITLWIVIPISIAPWRYKRLASELSSAISN